MGVIMNQKNKETMYKLLRDLSDVQGMARMTVVSLNAFIESIRQLKCTREEMDSLYTELSEALKRSQPNIAPLRHLLSYFEMEMAKRVKPDMDVEEVRSITIACLRERIHQFQRNAAQVTENGLAYIEDNDVIVVHSPSTVVTNILIQAKEILGRRFKVIILDHNAERTRQVVLALRESGIDHMVTPAHNLSHHIEGATKMFVGAMTLTQDHKIVAPIGTAGAVSLCRLNGIKVHLFANTLHYSFRSSVDQDIFREQAEAHMGTMDVSMTTHSHDLVSLGFIDHIVTEIGEVSSDGKLMSAPTPVRLLAGYQSEATHADGWDGDHHPELNLQAV